MSFMPDATQKAKDLTKKDDTLTLAKPITQSEDFCAELTDGAMDFSKLMDQVFLVAVNTGSRNKPGLLASTMRGPFDFYEMVESVGTMWEREQHHAKVFVLTKDFKKSSSFLDEGTVDYIEARWEDIISTGILEAAIAGDDSLLIPAGLIETTRED